MKPRYRDDATPIPADQLRRDHRLATLSLIGTAFAVALMLAHIAGVGL